MNKGKTLLFSALLFATPLLAQASVESSLLGLKNVLLGSVLPIFALMAVGFVSVSFFTGNPNAKQHLAYCLIGCAVVFGAQSIVDLIERVVR